MKNILTIIILVTFFSCKEKPTVLQPTTTQSIPQLGDPNTNSAAQTEAESSAHQVIAKEVRQAERYTYILANEGSEDFWIAVPKQEIKKGGSYLYRDALLKTNFYSQEFKQNFEKIYLVSSIIAADKHPGSDSEQPIQSSGSTMQSQPSTGSISLKELFANTNKYSGQTITINGKCIKANYNIMGRNWYHIQDNSKSEGKLLDLTITSNEKINVGDQINFSGIIAINKDFGSGYKYEIIMEQATVN